MHKLVWLVIAVFALIVLIKENGGIDGWIEPAKPERQGPLISCSKLTENRDKADCFARNCLFDRSELNAPHCNVR